MRGTGLAIVLLAASAATARADDNPETLRLNSEAKVLFGTVLKELAEDKRDPVGTCTFELEWSRYGLDYETAHKALDLDVHASLQNPDEVATPAEVLGTGVPKDAFCDENARADYVKSRVDAWQTTYKALPKGAKRPPGFGIMVRSFSFPFFDRTFQRAVVVWKYDYFPVAFDDKGERRTTMFEGAGTAVIYRREPGGWRKVDEEELFHAN